MLFHFNTGLRGDETEFTTMASAANVKKITKRPRLTHETIKHIIKQKQAFYTDAVIKILFNMGYTSYNISQRLNDIEVLVRLLRPPITDDEETQDCFGCST